MDLKIHLKKNNKIRDKVRNFTYLKLISSNSYIFCIDGNNKFHFNSLYILNVVFNPLMINLLVQLLVQKM